MRVAFAQTTVSKQDWTTWNQVGQTIQGLSTNNYLGYTTSMAKDGNVIVAGITYPMIVFTFDKYKCFFLEIFLNEC
jgi:hypothetical protein